MNALRLRGARLLGAVFFAALLLVPLLESGHRHVDRDLAKPCAVCVVAHHSPAATAPVPALGAPFALVALASFAVVDAPIRLDCSPYCGRAPPRSTHIADV
jgi:hypothetical protein